MVTPYEGYVAVVRGAGRLTPGDHEKRSALFNSGAEAVENAVKIARPRPAGTAVVVFDHAYHGRTNLTMALTAKNMPYKHGSGRSRREVYRVPMAYPFRDGPGLTGAEAAAPGHLARSRRRSAPTNVAAVVIEPIQGEGGFVVPAPGLPARRRRVVRGAPASCSSPTRCRPASAAPATGSPASTRASCPT